MTCGNISFNVSSPRVVLVLQRLVQLVVPVHPPRALQIFTELRLEVQKYRSELFYRSLPRLFLSNEVHGEQRAHLFRERPVPLSKPAVLVR